MAIKKSELYSSLWASCDELRGGMDASQYKDYVLVMLFLKYISDKWAGQAYAPITIPTGASFKDMIALKGATDIGDQINKKIIAPIAEANQLAEMPDFNDVSKLGSGKEMVDRLTNLIAIFEDPKLDFSKNQAEGDDILGDAYEYLMRHFATESGKSKGQFYTPAEVSRIMAKIIGIDKEQTTAETTVYDPACGSGSLLLKISNVANGKVTLYGQEKDAATSGLARMNMILHNEPTALIKQGNTLANPLFLNKEENLKTFDYVVANPPFSDKRWSNGLNLPEDNPFNRFQDYGVPPEKNGDYAFLLHIVRSLKRHGKGAIILPHGVLFRGNAEAVIRQNLIRKGYIKGIIGLPANLFYGTGIPACIILIDKENAQNRKGIFMIDAGKGFVKDGNKNRLREQDIHRVADVFNQQEHIPGFSKMVSITDIEANDFNLNIPRYIESQETEDIQDIEAHLLGGIPNVDIDVLQRFWEVFPNFKKSIFTSGDRPKYSALKIDKDVIRDTIYQHPEFVAFTKEMNTLFNIWKTETTSTLKSLNQGFNPKELIHNISESLLMQYENKALIDPYDMYQHIMTFWFETMQDDSYLITQDGWKAEAYRIIVEREIKGKENKIIDKGWTCDLVPKDLVITRYFKTEKEALNNLQAIKEIIASDLTELEEEHSSEDGYFGEMEKVNKVSINARIKELKDETDSVDELKVLKQYIAFLDKQTANNKKIKVAEAKLDAKLYVKYPTLTEDEVKQLVVDDKWMITIETAIKEEINHISQRLTNRVKELAERYENPLPFIDNEVESLETKVNAHLQKMGFIWN
ncbi:type I restriction-modification system subunit M [Bizionia myxarmorum]|uniref:site-specific DNA-methyltransferase (adenine-specific) n=1 Tax=Bizionia myxarmorum TaxID=291186 RepID=A0A5D0REN8_9FLAO|nr:type I restriction-modification system subunit M [Bizionia myxarmorum]TYB79168.1 type I restriction-modification system subunit M [Bizionia myxarmorum]